MELISKLNVLFRGSYPLHEYLLSFTVFDEHADRKGKMWTKCIWKISEEHVVKQRLDI